MAVYFGSNGVNIRGGLPVTTSGTDTTNATATESDILSGKTAYVKGSSNGYDSITGSSDYYSWYIRSNHCIREIS